MNYTQFHGNKFLFINKNANEFSLPKESCEVDLTMYYSHTGTFDGIANYKCSFFNRDGTEANLCGNALLALMEREFLGEYAFHTKAGVITGVNTDIGFILEMQKATIIQHNKYGNMEEMWQINIGNKHEIHLMNKAFEKTIYSRCLPNSSKVFNKHFITQQNPNTFEVRCFERGVGETDACGSGAYAVGIAMMKHFTLNEVKIVMNGGEYIVKDGLLIVKK